MNDRGLPKSAGPQTYRLIQETALFLHIPHTINISTSIMVHNLSLNVKHLRMVILLSLYSLRYGIEHCNLSIELNHATSTESG